MFYELLLPMVLRRCQFFHVGIFTGRSRWLGHRQIGAAFRFRVSVGLASALLCRICFPIAEKCSQDCWFLWISLLHSNMDSVVFKIHGNELASSMSVHQFLKMGSHFDQFCCESGSCSRRHVPKRTLCSLLHAISAALTQHFAYTRESSVQRSEQTVFVVSLNLQSSTIRNPFTTDCPIESSMSCSI